MSDGVGNDILEGIILVLDDLLLHGIKLVNNKLGLLINLVILNSYSNIPKLLAFSHPQYEIIFFTDRK
jgi:hypothetical protein